jgi:hypothetical protein
LVGGPFPEVYPVDVFVDINNGRHSFSPLIFGVSWANTTQIKKNEYTFNRWGGDHTTRYAFDILNLALCLSFFFLIFFAHLDANNRGNDWYFENIPNDNSNPSILPNNASSDVFVRDAYSTGSMYNDRSW